MHGRGSHPSRKNAALGGPDVGVGGEREVETRPVKMPFNHGLSQGQTWACCGAVVSYGVKCSKTGCRDQPRLPRHRANINVLAILCDNLGPWAHADAEISFVCHLQPEIHGPQVGQKRGPKYPLDRGCPLAGSENF
jgi:hypothetical protein